MAVASWQKFLRDTISVTQSRIEMERSLIRASGGRWRALQPSNIFYPCLFPKVVGPFVTDYEEISRNDTKNLENLSF